MNADNGVLDMHILTDQQRKWFSLVDSAIQANPFSEERDSIDRAIGGRPDGSLDSVISAVQAETENMIKTGKDRWCDYKESDSALVKRFLMFDFFHRYINDFDDHIEAQIIEGDQPIVVPFAKKGLLWLSQRGFSKEEALKLFATCFQLRRAFYFIDRGLVGVSPSSRRLREKLWNNVFTNNIERYDRFLWNRMEDFSTMIIGETGAGKGAAAAAIGRSGFIPFNSENGRFALSFTSAFISVNLAEFSDSLIEAELFGFVKGAFTGAVKDQDGVLSGCSRHGAIFLDEIGEVSPILQVKLLKVLEDRVFSPVGSREKKRFYGRIIAATNRRPEEMLKNGLMRPDFFYRLCSDTISVPPLRQRIAEAPEELFNITEYILSNLVGDEAEELTGLVVDTLKKELGIGYPWPGNVRELGQMIRRILLNQSCRDGVIKETRPDIPSFASEIAEGSLSAQEVLGKYCKHLYAMSRNYGEVARRTGIDWRTVKKYVEK